MRKRASSLLLLAALAVPARADAPASTAPVAAVSPRDQPMLAELRERRILTAEQTRWKPEEYTLLLRVREAEALGAFDLIRSKLGTLRGFALEHRENDGSKKTWLTLEGYKESIFLKSQEARAYFEERGAQARWVFSLRDLRGRLLFDASGILTQEGDEVFNRVKRKLAVFWRYPDGRVTGNVRPPPELLGAGPGAASPAPDLNPGSVEEAQAMQKISLLTASGYVEVTQAEVEFLLQTSKISVAQLQRESSLQVIGARGKIFYLMSPSDPLMALVARRRLGNRAR